MENTPSVPQENNENQPLTKKQRREQKRQQKIEERADQMKKMQQKNKMMWVALILFLSIVVIALFQLAGNERAPRTVTNEPVAQVNTENEWIKGNPDAQVTLIEYSDFQCPFCASWAPNVKKMAEELGSDVRIIYRHFPLSQHKNADDAAYAAEAAGLQGKFWEMHDIIFEEQDAWENSGNPEKLFRDYAQELGLNMDQFTKDMNSREVRREVDADTQSGVKAGVDSTPYFFLNGIHIEPTAEYEEFKKIIEEEILSVKTDGENAVDLGEFNVEVETEGGEKVDVKPFEDEGVQ